MIRGTTPTHIFTLPFETSLAKEIRVNYAQNDDLLIQKTEEDCTLAENTIRLTLTQEDTFKLDSRSPVQIQIRILTTDGTVVASKPQRVDVLKCLDEEVLE